MRVDLVALRHDYPRFLDARQVVEERRGPIVAEHVAQRDHGELIDRLNRSLRRWIVGTQRFDRVADEFEPDRRRLTGGIDVDDTAANRELTVLVRRILARKARFDEQFAEVDWGDVLVGSKIDRCVQQARRRADARQDCGSRRHHDSGRAARERMKGTRPLGRDTDVRRHPTVGIDLMRGERQDRLVRR